MSLLQKKITLFALNDPESFEEDEPMDPHQNFHNGAFWIEDMPESYHKSYNYEAAGYQKLDIDNISNSFYSYIINDLKKG